MNILICSAGRRVKLVSYFKEELSKINGRVIAIDCDMTAPALYFADAFEIVPRINDKEYIHVIKQLCNKYKINAVLSLIDPELTLLANYKEDFLRKGIHLIISDKETIEICFDKYFTYKFLKEYNLPGIPTYISIDEVMAAVEKGEISMPLIVKPRKGSASMGINTVYSLKELQILFESYDDLVIQPFIQGTEYGIDCYIDMVNYRTINIFCKRKLKMRAGETDKSEAIKDLELTNIIENLLSVLKSMGPIDIDCFKTDSGYVISEINPRFGGGYPHAHEVGQNFPKNIINNLQGIANKPQIGNYSEGSMLIKYDEIFVKN